MASSKGTGKGKKDETLRENERKWGKKLWSLGWVAIPSVVLKYQDELKLDSVDLALIMQLIRHWWYKDREPFPSIGELGRCLEVSRSTVQRHIRKLIDLRYIKAKKRWDSKHGGQTSNGYELLGLAMAAEKYADKELAERQKNADRDQERYMRGKRLAVVG